MEKIEQIERQYKIIQSQEEIIQGLRNLNKRSLNLSSKILYEWKYSFYIDLILMVMCFWFGMLIGITN